MIKRNLKEIKQMLGVSNVDKKDEGIVIHGVSIDSRNIKPSQLFVPIKGEKFNGHSFILDAIKGGAVATLWNKDEPIPTNINIPLILVEDTLVAIQNLAKSYAKQLGIKIVGITGSNGKTSTKDLLAGILSTKYKTGKTMGNLNNYLGVPLTILSFEEDVEVAVIEMGISELGEADLLSSIANPDVAIITNIGEAHLGTLYTRKNIAKAKLEIINHLNSEGLFIYPGDEQLIKNKMEKLNPKFKVETFGEESSNTYRPKLINIGEDGISFKLNESSPHIFNLDLLGKHQVYNATTAIAAAKYFNIPFENIQNGLKKADITGMRNDLIHTKTCTILDDSYKSNPTSVLVALDTLYSLDKYSRKIVVLGDMLGLGEEEISMHREIGEKIDPGQIDYLFTIGPLAKHIAEGASSMIPKNNIKSYMDKKELINDLKKVVTKDSIVLVKASRDLHLEDIVDVLKSKDSSSKVI